MPSTTPTASSPGRLTEQRLSGSRSSAPRPLDNACLAPHQRMRSRASDLRPPGRAACESGRQTRRSDDHSVRSAHSRSAIPTTTQTSRGTSIISRQSRESRRPEARARPAVSHLRGRTRQQSVRPRGTSTGEPRRGCGEVPSNPSLQRTTPGRSPGYCR